MGTQWALNSPFRGCLESVFGDRAIKLFAVSEADTIADKDGLFRDRPIQGKIDEAGGSVAEGCFSVKNPFLTFRRSDCLLSNRSVDPDSLATDREFSRPPARVDVCLHEAVANRLVSLQARHVPQDP